MYGAGLVVVVKKAWINWMDDMKNVEGVRLVD